MTNNALISIHPRYVDQIIAGTKTVEIRRRTVSLRPNTQLWIYSTAPVGEVRVLARVSGVEIDSPNAVWQKWGMFTGLDVDEYCRYLNGAEQATAISIEVQEVLEPGMGLSCLRSELGSFHPPQFFMRIGCDSELLRILRDCLPSVASL